MPLDSLRRFVGRLNALKRRRPPTSQQWFADHSNLEQLRAVLTDPVFVAACQHVLSAKRLDDRVIALPQPTIALMAAYTAGHADFLKDLERLATAPAERAPEPEPFSHIDAEYLNPEN
jgi:hypothetical protein